MNFLEGIGKRIRDRRIELNMTQEELGLKVGYTSRSSINKIELGLVDLPQSKILSISNALNVSPTYIMGMEDTPQENKLISLIEQLTDEETEELSRFVDYLISKRK